MKSITVIFAVLIGLGSTAVADSAADSTRETPLLGVNLAGAEFGRMPGVYGKDYTYPGQVQFGYCRQKGMCIIRLPFRWERLQPCLRSPLAADELACLDTAVAVARENDLQVLLDMHNYARYGGSLIGTAEVPVAAFADVWCRIAAHYREAGEDLAYGLMNEPHDTGGLWKPAAQAGIGAIRSVDRTHVIFVCGDGWSGAHSWKKFNADFLLNDPANRLVYEAHQYFDHDSSGTYRKTYDEENAYPDCGVDRLRPFAEWLVSNQVRGFIGEFGVPDSDPRWLVVLDRFLAAMTEAGIGGTYWAAGPWWGKYPLSVEPRGGEDRPQMAVLTRYFKWRH